MGPSLSRAAGEGILARREGLVDGALEAAAPPRVPAADVDPGADGDGAQAVARRQHGRAGLPLVGGDVVGLVLAEDAVGAFTAHAEDAALQYHRTVTRPRRG